MIRWRFAVAGIVADLPHFVAEWSILAQNVGVAVCGVSRCPTSDPGGSRTRDLRIKSPLLYQLSYRVEHQQRNKVSGVRRGLPNRPRRQKRRHCRRFFVTM